MADDMDARLRTLRRIAQVLGLPLAALFSTDGEDGDGADRPTATQAEVDALLGAFARLKDRQARGRVIDAAKAELERAERPPARPGRREKEG